MTSSSAVPPINAAAGDQSSSDSEEYEYEEVEIEEEVEVEEEVTDDDNDEIRKTTIISNDEKSLQRDGEIMTTETSNPVTECSKQVSASDKVPHFEEQTTQVNRKDVGDAQQKEFRFRHTKDTTNVDDIQNKAQKSDEGVSEGTRSDMSISAETIITCSSDIKPTLQKKILATNSSFSDVGKVNPPVKVNGYHFGLHNHDYIKKLKTSTNTSSSPWKSDSKFSSYNWEPSKPFRSAFLKSQGISTPDIQFDPVIPSIKPPQKNSDKLSKLSSSSQVNEKLKTEDGSNGMDMDSNEVADTKQETTKSASKGKEHTGDVVQASEVHVSSHYSLGQNAVGPTKVVNNKRKLDFDAEGDMNRESKPLRHFRAALIEFVKELVRPAWHDGKLSKDAHKLIVKKAVDKVLTTLQPEQVPIVKESIDMYLTSSQTKLMKLVEGYIAKYGKI